MKVQNYKEYTLSKYADEDIHFLINRKLLLFKQLEGAARTYVAYSDLHGSFQKYLSWIKNGLGYYRIAISEILGNYYSKEIESKYERLLLLVNRSKVECIEKFIENNQNEFSHQHFFYQPVTKKFTKAIEDLENAGLSRRRIINDLLLVLRSITRGDEHRIIKRVPAVFQENILKLYFKKDKASYESMIKGIVDDSKIYYFMTSIIVKLITANMIDKHINLGDTFDRGDGSDKLIKFYRTYFAPQQTDQRLHYIWGNHDILWMGACMGNPILCVTALRISMRYNNVDFLFRYGFNLDKLRDFALSCYKETPTGSYIKSKHFKYWPPEVAAKMTKVLLVLEAKLSVKMLQEVNQTEGEIDYAEFLKHYQQLLYLIPTGIEESTIEWEKQKNENPLYSDFYFPTIDPADPCKLTREEEGIVADLEKQFTSLPTLQDDINWMSSHGEMYRVVDETLFYHAAVPATDDMKLTTIKGMQGKKLLDFLQKDIKRIGVKKQNNQPLSTREKMIFWYLWCGKDSPFFCKSKMATLERAILNKEIAANSELTTWKETPNPYYKHIHNDLFLNNLLLEFRAQKVCMGHTPVKSIEQGILGKNLKAFIIDGGASDAYGDRGAVLINTPDFTYVTFHPTLNELKLAEKEDRLPDINIGPMETRANLKIRHMDLGHFLENELEAVDELLASKVDNFLDDYFV